MGRLGLSIDKKKQGNLICLKTLIYLLMGFVKHVTWTNNNNPSKACINLIFSIYQDIIKIISWILFNGPELALTQWTVMFLLTNINKYCK